MDTGAQKRFWDAHEQAARDQEYRILQEYCAALDRPLLEVLEKLSEKDQRVVMEYIQAVGALSLRLTELACIRLDQ